MSKPKVLFVIMDGAADEGTDTPLMTAKMPNLDLLARNSLCGMWEGPKAPPGYNLRSLSELGTLQLLGYGADETPGRGYLEALGIGLKPNRRAVYVRANFATVDKNLKIVDRRAGRDERGLDELAKLLSMNIGGVRATFYRSHGHRGVLALTPLKGRLSAAVSDSDVGAAEPQPIKPTRDDAASRRTAEILNEWSVRAHERLSQSAINSMRKLPANYILLRGAGQHRAIESFGKRWGVRACCIAASNVVKGISRYLGIKVADVKRATGKTDTDLGAKMRGAIEALKHYDFVLLHIKGTDSASHDKDAKLKRAFLERIDREVCSWLLHLRNINIVIATDHATSSKSGEHIFGPVPFMIYLAGRTFGHGGRFDERGCLTGFTVHNLMERLLIELRHRHKERVGASR
ncbi:MAG: phosphoglycerate mutase [Candidatus Aenigmatarchaeota archaeon]